MSAIFGGSKSKSTQSSVQSSSNQAFPGIETGFMKPATEAYQTGTSSLFKELATGYDGYKANTGFDFWSKLGLQKTGAGFAGRGLFNSGATQKALADYQQGIGSASYDNYLKQQSNLAGLGIQGGNLVGGAGGVSSGSSKGESSSVQHEGIGKFIGQIAGAAAMSDIRVKKDITKIGEHAGLGLYQFTYLDGAGPFVGVMAQEVEGLYPEALGPKTGDGYMTVNYNSLQRMTGRFPNDFA